MAGENVLGSFKREMTLSKTVLKRAENRSLIIQKTIYVADNSMSQSLVLARGVITEWSVKHYKNTARENANVRVH